MIERGGVIRVINAWKVLWITEHHRRHKRFEGDSPKPAVEFGKELKRRGVLSVHIISARKAFAPPLKKKGFPSQGFEAPPAYGLLWCPYCVKWREFEDSAIVNKDGIEGPSIFRCSICTVSIMDYYIKLYNPEIVERLNIALEAKAGKKLRISSARVRKPKDPRKVKGGFKKRRVRIRS